MSDYFVEGSDPSVLNCLAAPDTMGVVWHGAWSRTALNSADRIIRGIDAQSLPATVYFRALISKPDAEALDFVENYHLINRFLAKIGTNAPGDIESFNRIEAQLQGSSNGNWHVDPGELTALAVPVGVTSEYLSQPITGSLLHRGDFVPEHPDEAERMALMLPRDAMIVMKGKGEGFPRDDAHIGLVHRRPNQKIDLVRGNRMIVHLGL